MAKVIAVYNKKGGCGKTTTATTLAYLLARCGKRTALIDLDSQGDSSLAYGVPNPDKLQTTILSLVKQVIIGEPLPSPSSYMYSYHGVDLVPSNEEISTLERNLSNVDFREYILKEYISQISPSYDYIIIDCMPNFDTSMLNVMVCADSVVIPTQAEYYSAIGSMKFIRNFQQIRQHANPKLEIAGILITMNQGNTNLSTQITQELERTIGNQIRIFNTRIPRSVKVAEASGYRKPECGNRIYHHGHLYGRDHIRRDWLRPIYGDLSGDTAEVRIFDRASSSGFAGGRVGNACGYPGFSISAPAKCGHLCDERKRCCI